ncbi:MAG: hypothetical protein AB8B65_08410 [Kordia sp.]|uniref:hypothetical protein n=1 Tax=Kordia sp. TaxID=1965332 RepID=UPI00385FD548
MKNYTILFILSLLICSCSSDDDSETTISSIETTLIGKGSLYGGSSQGVYQQNIVINTTADWNNLILLFDAVNDVSSSFTETDIDFTNFTVIVAIDEVRGNGGHDLDIEVNSDTQNIIVTVTDLIPEGNATTVITQPYHIVKIPKNTLPVVFE